VLKITNDKTGFCLEVHLQLSPVHFAPPKKKNNFFFYTVGETLATPMSDNVLYFMLELC